MLIIFIKNNLLVLLITLGLPAGFAVLLTLVNRRTKINLVNRFGVNSQVYCGFLGIMLHELSHLIMAIIFRHGIESVRLIKRPHLNSTDGQHADLALGYVNHTWDRHKPYQVIGNLFIGVAPIFGCTAALLGLDCWLAPGLAQAIFKLAATPTALDWHGSWQALTSQPFGWWQGLLLLGFTLTIVIGGFDLSPADYQNSAMGLYSTIAAIVVVTSLFTGLGMMGWLTTLIAGGITVAIILGYSLLLSVIVMMLTALL